MATTPAWVVQSSSTGPSKQPAWVVPSGFSTAPKTTGFDPSKHGTHEDFYDVYAYGKPSGGNVGGEGSSQISDVDAATMADWERTHPNAKHIRDESVWSGGEGGSMTSQRIIDWDALPNKGMTKYGRIGEQVARINDTKNLNNADMIYFDPAYGWVTPKANVKQADKNIIGKIGSNGAMMASLAMGGLMGVALPAGMIATGVKTAMNTAPALAKGDYKSAAAGLVGGALGAGAQAMNLPSWVVPAAKTAYGVAKNGVSTDSLINAGLSFGAGKLGLPSWVVPTATSLGRMYTKGRN